MTREMSFNLVCYSYTIPYDRIEFGISVLQFVYLLADIDADISAIS